VLTDTLTWQAVADADACVVDLDQFFGEVWGEAPPARS
jgi:hypothetical protein